MTDESRRPVPYSDPEDDMRVRELMVAVIERWFPGDDAPYNRLDELLRPAREAGFELGVTTEMVDRWIDLAAQRHELVDQVAVLRAQITDLRKLTVVTSVVLTTVESCGACPTCAERAHEAVELMKDTVL